MTPIDWSNPEHRKNYYRQKSSEYRKEHPRLNINFSREDFELLLRSAERFGIERKRLSSHAKGMLLEAIRMGLGETVERPPQIPEETLDDMLYTLHSTSNNINQIAYNLNSEALEKGVRPVRDFEESCRIIDQLFSLIRETRDEILSLSPNTKTKL